MRRVLLLLTLFVLIAPAQYSQAVSPQTGSDDAAMKKLWLLSDLQALDADSVKLDEPLPRAVAKAEIADAAWALDMREALSLLKKGDRLGAERLAAYLKKASSIQEVYPVIIGKCVAGKDFSCVTSLAHQAAQQLKRAEDQPAVPSSFGALAKSVMPVSDTLALEMLDEAVQAANSSAVDTTQGRIGLEVDVFRLLVTKNEVRVRQAATNLKDRLQRIAALAAIYQWKAQELTKSVKATG